MLLLLLLLGKISSSQQTKKATTTTTLALVMRSVNWVVWGAQVRQDELEFFIKGNVSLEPAHRAKTFPWLPDDCWKHMTLLAQQFPDKFGTLLDDFAQHEYKWRRWYDADAPESMKYPKQYKNLSGFHRLMLLRCFRVDRVYRAITDYVSSVMGNRSYRAFFVFLSFI